MPDNSFSKWTIVVDTGNSTNVVFDVLLNWGLTGDSPVMCFTRCVHLTSDMQPIYLGYRSDGSGTSVVPHEIQVLGD